MSSRSDAELGILSSSMKDHSAAMLLGWGLARVKRERAALLAKPDVSSAVVVEFRPLMAVITTAPEPTPFIPTRLPRAPKPTPVCHLPERVQRWCGWFLAAGWERREVARLFGLRVRDLAAL